jgi:hypothetical protein
MADFHLHSPPGGKTLVVNKRENEFDRTVTDRSRAAFPSVLLPNRVQPIVSVPLIFMLKTTVRHWKQESYINILMGESKAKFRQQSANSSPGKPGFICVDQYYLCRPTVIRVHRGEICFSDHPMSRLPDLLACFSFSGSPCLRRVIAFAVD